MTTESDFVQQIKEAHSKLLDFLDWFCSEEGENFHHLAVEDAFSGVAPELVEELERYILRDHLILQYERVRALVVPEKMLEAAKKKSVEIRKVSRVVSDFPDAASTLLGPSIDIESAQAQAQKLEDNVEKIELFKKNLAETAGFPSSGAPKSPQSLCAIHAWEILGDSESLQQIARMLSRFFVNIGVCEEAESEKVRKRLYQTIRDHAASR